MSTSLAPKHPSIIARCECYAFGAVWLATGEDFKPKASDFGLLVALDTQMPGSRSMRWTELTDALEALPGRHVHLVHPRYRRNPYFCARSTASELSLMTNTIR